MYKLYCTLGCCFITLLLSAQSEPVEIGRINDVISEPSGIAIIYNKRTGQFDYWLHNDYNYPDSIFSFSLDNLEEPSRVLDIEQDYYDWEDMAIDKDDNLYLGDFGNWVPSFALRIIKVPSPNKYTTPSPAHTEVISYEMPFDGVTESEAMFHNDGHLYFLSKTVRPDINPDLNENYSYLFRIPDLPKLDGGKYVAELVDSLQVRLPGDPADAKVKITGADMSPDGQQLVLLGYERSWVFSCFEEDDFFSGKVSTLNTTYRQYEGIAFINNYEVIISKEGSRDDPNYNPILYYLDLAPLLPAGCLDCNKVVNGNFDEAELAWSLFQFGGGTAEADLDMTSGRAELKVNQLSTSQWHANLRHKGIILEKGRNYTVSYTANSAVPTTISIIMNKADGSQGYFYKQTELSTQPSLFSHDFVMTEETDYNSFLSFNVGNSALTTIYLDDISLSDECSSLTALEETNSKQEVSIYPNPVRNKINLMIEGEGLKLRASLYDLNGKLIKSFSDIFQMHVDGIPNGVYLLELMDLSTGEVTVHRISVAY